MDVVAFARIIDIAGPVAFWSVVLGAGLSCPASNSDVLKPMRNIFAVFATLFFTIAVCAMSVMLWAAVQ